MKTVLLIRHAESQANVGRTTSNAEAIELTEAGLAQAQELAERINQKPELIVTSPYIRTLHTAQPLLDKFSDVKHEQWHVHEFTYLSPAKCRNTTMEERIPWAIEYWERNDPDYRDGDGVESFADFIKRICQIQSQLSQRPEQFIIVFSHFQFINAILWLKTRNLPSNITGVNMQDFRIYLLSQSPISNAQIIRYEV
jgi:probable phosphoglycerate mutase